MRKARRLWLAVAAFSLSLAASAAMAQEVAEGQWIKLFDGETLYGWTAFGDAAWKAENGAIVAGGEDSWSGLLATNSRFANFELTMKAQVSEDGALGVAVRGSLEGHPSETGSPSLQLKSSEKMQEVSIRAEGAKVTATVDGKAVDMGAAQAGKGRILLQYQRGKKPPKIVISEVKLRPLAVKAIFNGKDLAGWNLIPEHKSVFKVVDGAINVTNGNGQLETDGVYRDFVLQLDIISNGDSLNSGVFFRGPKGVFWKGYESQVRNQWVDKEQGATDRTKPVDFGTGGLYGDQPSRKVVSSDREWFNKTIVCDGDHIAIWLNGYQTADFFETRPAVTDSNGKAGYVPEAGTIHLQGHDPTTDLSFKNINVGEYPAK